MSAQLQANLSLRPMHMGDLDTIMQIEPVIYSHPWTRGNFSDSLNSGYNAWVLEKQVLEENTQAKKTEMLGYSLMMIVMDEAHLLNLSIAKHRQKQGLGRYLLAHMMTIAKRHKAANMFLEVRTSNVSAIALYENIGFCEMAVRRGYYPAHSGREDAVLMGLAL
jgi:[ribosomal protein S18]-alanine N-acetyltransferase